MARDAVRGKFALMRSVVGEYARLMTGNGYDFKTGPSFVSAVAQTGKPAIPMMISILPPDTYPTLETEPKEIYSPSGVALTAMTERITPEVGPSRTVERIVSVDPAIAEEAAAIQKQIDESGSENERLELQQRLDRLVRQVPRMTVHVPQQTPEGREAQIERTKGYLEGLRDRYDSFQKSKREYDEMSDPPGRRVRHADPWAATANIKDARAQQVREDLQYLRDQALLASSLPPLFMYVNPSSKSTSYDHIVSDGSKTRDGYTIEFWGQQLETLTLSGTVGAFYVHQEGRGGGLAVNTRRGSYAYQQLMALYQMYRNNGYIYNRDGRISLVGAVAIYYDGTIYTGSFNSFNITHSESKPFTLDYSFTFTVRYRDSMGNR